MASPQPGPGLGGRTGEPLPRPRVEDRRVRVGQRAHDRVAADQRSGARTGGEVTGTLGASRREVLDREPGQFPGGQPSVEHRDSVETHGADHPPGPGAGVDPGGVVHDDGVRAVHPEGPHLLGEPRRPRHRVRQRYCVVGHGPVDVEAPGTRNAPRGRAVRTHRGVEHHGPRPLETPREPVHIYERAGQVPRPGVHSHALVLDGHERHLPASHRSTCPNRIRHAHQAGTRPTRRAQHRQGTCPHPVVQGHAVDRHGGYRRDAPGAPSAFCATSRRT